MVVYNADGSIPEMCGNGLRCVAMYLFQKHHLNEMIISTGAGPLLVRIREESAVTFTNTNRLQTVKEMNLINLSFLKTMVKINMGKARNIQECCNVHTHTKQLKLTTILSPSSSSSTTTTTTATTTMTTTTIAHSEV